MYLNLHGYTLEEAKKEVNKAINTCYKNKDEVLEICHGYNNGTVIKNWLRSQTFNNVSYVLPDLTNNGVTKLYIKRR